MRHVVAVSGGKDSTAMALRLAEIEPRDYEFIITPTGNELPEMVEHWRNLESLLGKPLLVINEGVTLENRMERYNALPNHRQRWCTRELKIIPTIRYLKSIAPAIQYVGLRADEEGREGISEKGVESDFPLRRWGWGITEVKAYLEERGVTIPERTDCAWCYGQRLAEWQRLSVKHPEIFKAGVEWEEKTGHTFRSPHRDTRPAGLIELITDLEANPLPARYTDDFDGCSICRK